MRTGRAAGWITMAGAAVACCLAVGSALAAPPAGGRQHAPHATQPAPTAAPGPGAQVRVWSRFDGVVHKVVWSRFENGRWTEPRVVTFGQGDDLAPAFGVASQGSFLFWSDGRGRILYAPFDPDFGRLFAAPRTLAVLAPTRRPSAEGGTDAPIILGTCGGSSSDPCVGSGSGSGGTAPLTSPSAPPPPSPEGGTDAPIIIGTDPPGGSGSTGSTGGTNATTVTTVSSPGCSMQVLAAAFERTVAVFSVDGAGRVEPLGRYVMAPGITQADATAAAAAHFFPRICH